MRIWSISKKTEADNLLDIEYENLAVADLSRVGRIPYGLNSCLQQVICDNRLNLHFGQKIDDIFCPSIELRMSFLSAEALYFRYSQAVDADFGKRLSNIIEFEGLDDGGNLLHDDLF